MKFIKKTWGKDGLKECGTAIGFSHKEIREGKWYEDEVGNRVTEWIADNKGEEYVERCGNYMIKDLGMLSYIVGFMDVKSILKRAPESYTDALNYGRLEVDIGESSAVISIKGTAPIDKHACLIWLGTFRGVLEITKTKGTVTETKCAKKGAPHCEYLMEWG